MSKLKALWLIFLIIILLGGGAYWFFQHTQKPAWRLQKSSGEEFISILINLPEKQTADLAPAEGITATEAGGTAYRFVKKDRFYFAALAFLPALEQGEVYQVKLSKDAEELVIGNFNRNETSQWLIWHKADNNLSNFNKVRVLKGGDVILGGSF